MTSESCVLGIQNLIIWLTSNHFNAYSFYLCRRKNGCALTLRQDIKQSHDDFQKDRSRFDQESENEPARNLRRSLSENVLFTSPQKREEYSIPLSPFTRRFSQRGLKELETACDLVMENPINVENTSQAETSLTHLKISP